MIRVKIYSNTALVSFDKEENLTKKTSGDFGERLMSLLKKPFTNLILNLEKVEKVDADGLQALLASQRLSEMNRSQLSLLNVKEGVLKTMKERDLDSKFFFCDRPKPFSNELLMV